MTKAFLHVWGDRAASWPGAWCRLFLVLLALLAALAAPVRAATDLLDPSRAFVATAAMADPLHLDLHYAIAPGYYMYQERFGVTVSDAQNALLLVRHSTLEPQDAAPVQPRWSDPVRLPRGEVKYDPTFEKDMEVYHKGVTLRVPLQAGASGPLRVRVTGQGCADQGVCYPPMDWTLTLVADGAGYRAQGDWVRDRVPPPVDQVLPAGQGGRAATGSKGSFAAAGTTGSISAAGPAVNGAGAAGSLSPWSDSGDLGMAAWLHQAALWQILVLSLLFGVLLSFTPCVLPMVPILLALVTGSQAGGPRRRLHGLGLAAAYVFGMSIVYTLLGVAAGLLGAGLSAWLQSPWVLGVFAVLLALFALGMLGAVTIQVPVSFQSALQARLQAFPGGHAGGVFVMGMISALIVGPCVAAPLAGILLFISQTGDVVIGASALFAMAWGEGLLLLAVGAGAGALLPRVGLWMDAFKSAFGILLLATAWWMARPLLGDAVYVAGWVLLALWAALLLWAAGAQSSVRQAGSSRATSPVGHVADRGTGAAAPAADASIRPLGLFVRAIAVGLALWGLAQGAGLLAGGRDMLRPLAPFGAAAGGAAIVQGPVVDPAAIRARFVRVQSLADLEQRLAATDRPVMLDFYADWCVSCLEMEKFTFSDPAVAQRMSGLLLLQADVTRMSPEDLALLKRFDLFGPPGIMFFDAQGRHLPDARVIGYQPPARFMPVLDRVLGASVPFG